MRHIDQQVILEEAERLLRSVQHFDQCVLLVGKAFQRAVNQLEARVTTGVSLSPSATAGFNPWFRVGEYAHTVPRSIGEAPKQVGPKKWKTTGNAGGINWR